MHRRGGPGQLLCEQTERAVTVPMWVYRPKHLQQKLYAYVHISIWTLQHAARPVSCLYAVPSPLQRVGQAENLAPLELGTRPTYMLAAH